MSVQSRENQTVAALFSDEQHARLAMRELDQMGYKRAWMGVVRSAESNEALPVVDASEGGGMFEAIGRIFGGEGDRSLHAVLTSHGLESEQANAIATRAKPMSAVLTISVEDGLDRALEIIEAHGGDVGDMRFSDRSFYARRESGAAHEALFL